MDKLSIKNQIHESVNELIERKKADFQKEMSRLEQDELNRETDQFDLAQKSQDESDHELNSALGKQLGFANQQLLHLQTLDGNDKILEKVRPGAVVVTNKGTFYISVATDDFKVDGLHVRGLSPDAPIYNTMQDKQKGDRFSFRENEYLIEDLF